MRRILFYFLLLFLNSCIPLSVAPTISEYKITKAKRFKRDLPKVYGFIIEDRKYADEFYHFINLKYDLGHLNVETNVPFQIDGRFFYLSFFEREKVTRTLNLIPIFVDAKLASDESDPLLEEHHSSRIGKWYIIITVADEQMEDALASEYELREKVIQYLKDLKEEYYSTDNYMEAYLKGKN